jgi:hypothetical protein
MSSIAGSRNFYSMGKTIPSESKSYWIAATFCGSKLWNYRAGRLGSNGKPETCSGPRPCSFHRPQGGNLAGRGSFSL